MYSCPIAYFQDNLIFGTDKSCWAAFKLKGFDYDMRSKESKDALHRQLTRFIANIPVEAKIHLIPTSLDVDVHYDRLIKGLDPKDPLYDLAISHAEGTRAYLKDKFYQDGGFANEYQAYVVVKLQTEDHDMVAQLADAFAYFIKDPLNAFDAFMGLDARDILDSQIRQFKHIADDFLREQKSRIDMVPTETIETQWLLRRGNFRGLRSDVLLRTDVDTSEMDGTGARKKSWTPFARKVSAGKQTALQPYRRDVVNLFEGVICLDEKRALRIEHSDGSKSYQGFLAFTHIPDGMVFPGCEWLFLLQEYRVQCEICIHIHNVEHRQALRKLDGKKREIKSQMEDIVAAASSVPDEVLEAEESAISLENELKQFRDPLSRATVTLCFSGETLAEMEGKLNYIRGVYTDFNFILERPLTDQYALYLGMVPGAGIYTTDFVLPLPPSTIAGGIFGATRLLGDGLGPYVGTTGPLEQNVFLNIGLAPLRNESAATTFYGNLGQGKSFNANTLTYLTVLYGGSALIFCPKGERAHWIEDFKYLRDRELITSITLSADESFRGALDPFIIYRDDVESACALAQNIVAEYNGLTPKDMRYVVLSDALERIKREPVRGMSVLADILDNYPRDIELGLDREAKMLAHQLRAMQNIGMSKLLFGTGKEKALDLNNRLNILMIQNLQLPSPDTPKDQYTSEELLSTVIMSVMGAFAKKFAMTTLYDSMGRVRFKVSLFDESWALGKTVEGVKLYEFLTRMGRSLNFGCIFNGHSVLDIPTPGIRETIKYKFCFKTDNEEEAVRMLEYMSMDVTDENIQRIKNLRNGECMFQDLDKRVGILRFDVVFRDLALIFSTTPGKRAKLAEGDSQHLNVTDDFDFAECDIDLTEEVIQ